MRLWPLWSLALVAQARAQESADVSLPPDGISIEADQVICSSGDVVGVGDVRLSSEAWQMEAARFRWEQYPSRLELEQGTLSSETCTLSFGSLQMEDGELRLSSLTWHGRGPLSLRAANGVFSAGEWMFTDVEGSICQCAGRPLWGVSARSFSLVPEESVSWRRGWLRVADLPVLPMPWGRLPLRDRQSGLLAPRLGWTQDGPEAGVPVYWAPAPSLDVTVTPLYRQERGWRADGELRYALPGGDGQVDLVAGQDILADRWRGAAAWRHGWAPGVWRTAVDSRLVSDDDYLDDFGGDYLGRQLGFQETRALLGWGPLWVDHDGFQAPGQAVTQRIIAATLSSPAVGAGAISGWGRLETGLEAEGESLAAQSQRVMRLAAGAGLRGAGQLGVLSLEGDLGVVGQGSQPLLRSEESGQFAAAPLGSLRLSMPLWRDYGLVRHLLRMSWGGGYTPPPASGGYGLAGEAWRPEWWTGPRLESLLLSACGVPAHLVADLPFSAGGLEPSLTAWWDHGPWWLAFSSSHQVDTSQQEDSAMDFAPTLVASTLGYSGERLTLETRLVHVDDALEQTQAALRGRWEFLLAGDRWTPGYRLRVDLQTSQVLEHGPELAFRSRCGCLWVRGQAIWAEDRAWPDLVLQVDVGE